VHKSTHHFDLINWWLDADPAEVSALGSLVNYGKAGPFRHTHCRPCPHKDKCNYYWDITRQPRLVELYVNAEKADGYLRDGCVYRQDIDIFDTMNAVVKYSTGVQMSYAVHTYMPIEGYAWRSTARRGASRCATTSARRGIRAKRRRCT
jgi:predicted dehydrogenase